MKSQKQTLLFILLLLLVSNTYATTIYVKHDATGGNNGNSWADAYTDLQDAMNAAAAGDEIWVAAGTYKPTQHPDTATTADPRAKSFFLNKDLKIYGGFAGTETLLSQRDYDFNQTTLSADIGVMGDVSDNCFHVFMTTGLTSAAVIDGFIIKDANANISGFMTYAGATFSNNSGGGFYNLSSSPTLANLTVINNAARAGGGFYNVSSSPTLTDVVVANNSAVKDGGGFNNISSSSVLTNVTVMNNTANRGGGFYNLTSPLELTNVVVNNNSAATNGGGLSNTRSALVLTNVMVSNNSAAGNGGGFQNLSSSPLLTNVVVSHNFAARGGAFSNSNSSPLLTNVTISNNSATRGGAFSNTNSSLPIIRNSIIWNNSGNSEVENTKGGSATFYYSIIKGSGGSNAWVATYGTDGGNNLDTDPLFVDATNGDFSLQVGSPANNIGNNAYNTTTTDLTGTARIQDGMIDLGAYEMVSILISSSVSSIACFGENNGSITLNVSGGLLPYTYLWNNGSTSKDLSNLSAGTYIVTLTDANGFTATDTNFITEPAAELVITQTSTRPSCNGGNNGSINLTVTGGTAPYIYTWSDGGDTSQDRTNLIAGVYKVTVTDANGCFKTRSITILQPTALVLTSSVNNLLCYGDDNGRINLTVTGGVSPYTYAWSDGSNTTKNRKSLSAGDYTVTVTDTRGCSVIDTMTITEPSEIDVTMTVVSATGGINNGSITLVVTGGTAPYAYLWNDGNTSQNRTGLPKSNYTVTITDDNGCTKTIITTVARPAFSGGSNETKALFDEPLSLVYPNPAIDFFNVKLENAEIQEVQINVFSSMGALIHSETTQTNTVVSTQNWSGGVYRVQVRTKDKVQTHSVIIQR